MKKEIYINIGPSASGKSTYIRNRLAGKKHTIVSMDMMREELTGDMGDQSRNSEVYSQMPYWLKYYCFSHAPEHAIIGIDNTNLKVRDRKVLYEAIEEGCKQGGHEFKITLLVFEPDLARSIRFQSKRMRKVPEDIIKKQAEKFTKPTDYEESQYAVEYVNPEIYKHILKPAVFGDVHGQWSCMEELLGYLGFWKENGIWHNSGAYFPISLGDLNDYKFAASLCSSVRCLETMMDFTKRGWAEVIQSNHHNKLQRYLDGNKITPSHGLQETINEIEGESMDFKGELFAWLKARPYYHAFEVGKQKYVCAHAYIDNRMLETKEWTKAQKDLCIYGPRSQGNNRIEWWADEEWIEKFDKFYPICGHYHYFTVTPSCAVLDDEERLTCLLPADNTLIWTQKITKSE